MEFRTVSGGGDGLATFGVVSEEENIGRVDSLGEIVDEDEEQKGAQNAALWNSRRHRQDVRFDTVNGNQLGPVAEVGSKP